MPPPRPRRHARRSTCRDAARRRPAGLDPCSRNGSWSLVDEIAADGTTVLLTSQYLEEVERLADRVVVIDRASSSPMAHPTPALRRRRCPRSGYRRPRSPRSRRRALGDLGDGSSLNRDEQRIAVPTRQGIPALITAARRLDDADIALADLGLRRPSLDDVFFAITGDRAEPVALDLPASPTRDRRNTGDRAGAGAPTTDREHGAAHPASAVRYLRAPQVLYLGTAQPVVFLVMLNAVFGGLVTGSRGGSYVQYLLPGVIVMNVLLAQGRRRAWPRTCATGSSTASAACRCPARGARRPHHRRSRPQHDRLAPSSSSACSWGSGSMLACQRRSEVSVLSCSSPSPSPGSSRFSAWR